MTKKKLAKRDALQDLPNVLEETNPDFVEKIREHTTTQSTIRVELACGKGEYTLALAQRYPGDLAIGIDIKGERIWHGASQAIEKEQPNTLFLRTKIEQIEQLFAPHSLAEIWIIFPDPFPKKRHANRRLTSPAFLERYTKLLAARGSVALKTDDPALFTYSKEQLAKQGWHIAENFPDIDKHLSDHPLLAVQTFYEKQHRAKGRTMQFVRAIPPPQKK